MINPTVASRGEPTTPAPKASNSSSAFQAAAALTLLLNSCLEINAGLTQKLILLQKDTLDGAKIEQERWLADMNHQTDQTAFGKSQAKYNHASTQFNAMQKNYQVLFDAINDTKNTTSSSIQQVLQLMGTLSQGQSFIASLMR